MSRLDDHRQHSYRECTATPAQGGGLVLSGAVSVSDSEVTGNRAEGPYAGAGGITAGQVRWGPDLRDRDPDLDDRRQPLGRGRRRNRDLQRGRDQPLDDQRQHGRGRRHPSLRLRHRRAARPGQRPAADQLDRLRQLGGRHQHHAELPQRLRRRRLPQRRGRRHDQELDDRRQHRQTGGGGVFSYAGPDYSDGGGYYYTTQDRSLSSTIVADNKAAGRPTTSAPTTPALPASASPPASA